MTMVAAVVLILTERASLATGEAMAPQAFSFTVQTTRLRMGTAMKPASRPKAAIASPEASHSRPPESLAGFFLRSLPLTRCSLTGTLPGRRLEPPLLQDILSFAARHKVHPHLREGRLLRVLERGDRIGRDDIQVRRDGYDLHLIPHVGRVVACVAEGGVSVPDDDPVDRRPNVGLPRDDVGEDLLLEAGPVHFVRLAQDLHRVVSGRDAFLGEHELCARLRQILETLYVCRVVVGDHDDLAILDEVHGLARD